MISLIAQDIGKQYADFLAALDESRNLTQKGSLTADEREKLSGLVERLRSDRSAELLVPEQRKALEDVLKKASSLFRVDIPTITNAGDYIVLEDIACIDADGKEFEHYDQLLVRKDFFRDQQRQQSFTPYNAAVYCEQQGLFLPSFALSCNILAALYQNQSNSDINHVLMQYKDKDKGNGYGYHAQNTLVNFGIEQILHYPSAADFGQAQPVNRPHTRTPLGFSKATLEDSLLENALRDPAALRYVQQLTGLHDPSVLVEIGQYFGKPAKLWFPWNGKNGKKYSETRACWLGCYDFNFNLGSDNDPNYIDAARGVRR